jgi:hypothetical protein
MPTRAKGGKKATRSPKRPLNAAASKKEVRALIGRALKALAKHPNAAKSRHAQKLLQRMERQVRDLG